MSSPCLFCERPAHIQDFLFESEYFYVLFDVHPVSPGHTLVIPKRHVVSFFDMDEREHRDFFVTIARAKDTIGRTNFWEHYQNRLALHVSEKADFFYTTMLAKSFITTLPEAYTIGINDGAAAGRTIHHLHIHIIPRFTGDVPHARGGVRTIFPELGDYMK